MDRFKQLIPHRKFKLKIRRFARANRTSPQYQAWVVTKSPLSPSVWTAAVQLYYMKQFISKMKRKVLERRHTTAKYGTPKFQAWLSVIPKYVAFASVFQPYRYEGLSTKIRNKLKAKHRRIIAKGRFDKYDSYVIATIGEFLQSIPVTIINILNKVVKISK